MLLFFQIDPTSSHDFLFRRFNLRGPPAFIEMKQQKNPGKKNSNISHGDIKNLQITPHSTSLTL